MDKQRIILIGSALLVVAGVVGAYLYYQKTQISYMLGTETNTNMNKNNISTEKCIVTVRGDRYDVTEFRNKHKGGDIFKCGEDMTDAFNKQHGEKQLRDLQRYRVN